MDLEKSRTEFLRIMMENEQYHTASDILAKHDTEFTIYSCTNDTIDRVVKANDDELKEIITLINEANAQEKHIKEIELIMKRSKRNGLEDFFTAFEDDNTKERLFVLLGETGVGKSYIIEQRYPDMVQYACNKALDTYSLCYYLADNGNGLAPHETPFLQALKNGGKVFLDEMNELPHETLMFLQGITDEKKSVVIGNESVTISPSFKIMAALNPPSETDERTPLGDALLSRSVGYVLELTDSMIMERCKVNAKWLAAVRNLHRYVQRSGMIDIRELSFRDYQRFAMYDFENQFKYKICMGDVSNIRAYERLASTGEFAEMLEEVLNAIS